MFGLISIVIPGRPVPFARAGSNGKRRYTPAKQAAYMTGVGMIANRAMSKAGYRPFDSPLHVQIRAIYAPPKKQIISSEWMASRPDADNIGKILCDAMNGIVWLDDAQVCYLCIQKKYGIREETVVTVTELRGIK